MKLTLTTLKPLHSTWIIEFYNKMTSGEVKPIIQNGWKSAGIEDALKMGKRNMPSLDPFFDIDLLLPPPITPIQPQAFMDKGVLSCNEEDGVFIYDNAWMMEGENVTGNRNTFDGFVNEGDDL